tara:strand:+ start:1815 stop:2117 length:303 start_codon:yes stop_codon:yes gene_type:complete
MTFQKTVIYIALVILIIMLLFIGYAMYNSKLTEKYPPHISQCPDYWKVVGKDGCENVQNLGNCPGTVDFSGSEWQGSGGLKKKKEWAKGCGVVWDGVTYG